MRSDSRGLFRERKSLNFIGMVALFVAGIGDPALAIEKGTGLSSAPPTSYVSSIERLFVLCGVPIRLFDISPVDGTIFRELPIPPGFQDVGRCGMSLVGKELLLGGENGQIAVIDSKTGEFLRSYPAPHDPITSLGYIPEQGVLAGGSLLDSTPAYFSPVDGSFLRLLTDPNRQHGMAGGPLGNLIAWNQRDRVIEQIDEETGKRSGDVSAEDLFVDTVSGLGFTGRLLFLGEPNNRLIKVVDYRNGTVSRAFPAPLSPVCALAAGPDDPSIRYLQPADFPLFVSGSFRADRDRAIQSGKLMIDWIRFDRTETFELFSYRFSGEFRNESFDEEIPLDRFPAESGVFDLYALGTDTQDPPQTTPKETALERKLTIVVDGTPPNVLVVEPKSGDYLNQADLPPDATGFPVLVDVSEDTSGLQMLQLFSRIHGETDFVLESTFYLDGEKQIFHEFRWNPSSSGIFDLKVVATDRSRNEGAFTVNGLNVNLDVQPTPTPGPPVGVAAHVLYASPELHGEIFSTVTIAELDGDAEPEFVFGTDRTNNATDEFARNDDGMGLFAINFDGTNVAGRWPVILDGDVRSSPAAADLDRDGLDEVAVGAYPKGLYLFDHDGTQLALVPTNLSVLSSPAIGNLDEDLDLEIVVGTSDGTLLAVNADGTDVEGWPVTPPPPTEPLVSRNDIDSSPAIGDITGDGYPEVVALSDNGVVYAYHHDGTPVAGFPYEASRETFHMPVASSANSGSPILADVDGNGTADIVVGMTNGRVYGLDGTGTLLPGFPLRLPPDADPESAAGDGDDILSAPVVSDIDGDSLLELGIVFYSGSENRSRLYLYDLPAPANHEKSPWWTFQGNSLHNGFFNGPPTGDIDRNGEIDSEDARRLFRGWYRTSTMPGYHPAYDFDFSRQIGAEDLIRFLSIDDPE